VQIANDWGGEPTWSPDGDSLVLSNLMLAGEEFVVRLVRIDLGENNRTAGSMLDISGEDDRVDDESPDWSPGGGWIAVGRRYLDDERWTPGRQPWLSRPDGSEAYQLVDSPMHDHFAFTWRPDGGALAYVSTDLSQGQQVVPDTAVWVFDFERRRAELVDSGAVRPKWLP
jgi:Tol biopolymer transport system component